MTPVHLKICSNFTEIKPGFYSFVGPVSYFSLRNKDFGCVYYCDGILAARFFSLFLQMSIERTSFDYSSIASPFFSECERRGLRVRVVGGKPLEAKAFSEHLAVRFPFLMQECIDGYPPGGFCEFTFNALSAKLVDDKVDVLILALGSPLQERVGQAVIANGFLGTVITAGAFVTQTALTGYHGSYYPNLVNAMHLRFLWRLIHEPHTRSRFKYVLLFPFAYMFDRLRARVSVMLYTS